MSDATEVPIHTPGLSKTEIKAEGEGEICSRQEQSQRIKCHEVKPRAF